MDETDLIHIHVSLNLLSKFQVQTDGQTEMENWSLCVHLPTLKTQKHWCPWAMKKKTKQKCNQNIKKILALPFFLKLLSLSIYVTLHSHIKILYIRKMLEDFPFSFHVFAENIVLMKTSVIGSVLETVFNLLQVNLKDAFTFS